LRVELQVGIDFQITERAQRDVARSSVPSFRSRPTTSTPSATASQVLDAEDPFGFGMNGVLEFSPLGLFGVAIPPAAPASGCGGPADGWRRAGGLPRAVYRNVSGQWLGYGTPPICFPMPARGNVEAVVDDRRARGRAVRIRVETRGSTIGFPAEPMRATVSLGATLGPGHAGRCGLWVSERCTTSGDGSTMRCR